MVDQAAHTKPRISVIICSRNRAAQLAKCLESISASEMLAAHAELVLIDNDSADETSQVMERYGKSAEFPVIMRQEPTPGLSRARNRGLQIARGELVVFTDDDCYMDGGYLVEASRIFATEEFDYGGGQMFLQNETDAEVGYNIFEDQSTLTPNSFIPAGSIQGANMIFRRKVIDEIGEFDCMLGAGTDFPSEDIDYVARASYAGFTGGKFPRLLVYHDHQRKPGKERKAILKTYDLGRGAYYAKYILQGRLSFLFHWLRQSSFERDRNIINELTGAYKYIVKRMRK